MPRTADPGFPLVGRIVWRHGPPVVRGLSRLMFSLQMQQRPMPDGPVVVAANHYSHLDPIVVGLAAGRPVRFLAVDELFGRSRAFDAVTLSLGAIPMTRTRVPFGPLKLALAELDAGRSVGVFPEGVRVWTWGERSPKRGAAWLALRAGVPLVPVAVAGTDLAMGREARGIRRSPVAVAVGEPILPDDHAGDDDPVGSMSHAWAHRIGALLETM